MKIIVVGTSSYSVGETTAGAVVKTAKDAMKGQNAIYAIEKGGIIEMKKDVFPSAVELQKAVGKYRRKGFKVSYIVGGDGDGK
jgi:hypothetical protein